MEGGRAVHRAKGSSGLAAPVCHARRSLVNAGAPWPVPQGAGARGLGCRRRRWLVNAAAPWPVPKVAEARVLGIQRKLHKWASDDPNRRFSDLHNLVCDPATLMVAGLRG